MELREFSYGIAGQEGPERRKLKNLYCYIRYQETAVEDTEA
jgi:hypothetical protein